MDPTELLVAVNIAVAVGAVFAAGVLVGLMKRGEDHV